MNCTEIADSAVVERYVAGKLDARDAEAFETHLVDCQACQDAVQLAVLGRRALRSPAVPAARHRRLPLLAGLLAAAGIIGVAVFMPRQVGNGHAAELGGLSEPPIYLGVMLRGGTARHDSLFDAAMAAYNGADYRRASDALRDALAAGSDSARTQFFLGASLLMLNDNQRAADVLGRVADGRDTPYTAEAHYYRAKALLRLGRSADALAELRRITTSPAEIAPDARALADSVERASRR